MRAPVVLGLLSAAALAPAAAGADVLPGRAADPVVLTGAQVPTLVGAAPGQVVAFVSSAGTWQQIPVQVDERAVVSLARVYGNTPGAKDVTELTYTDPNTFTGPDPNPNLDADDEIAFMARDAGAAAPAGPDPSGVVTGSGVALRVTDPLHAGAAGYVYLYRSAGALDPGAGKHYVTYDFHLSSGDYKTTYKRSAGPNPENSTITTPYYRQHFSDRWIDDELHLLGGGATGVDILDRHKDLFGPGVCGRSEDTFSSGEGAFIVNKSGPVRAIREYIGANSGPSTERDHVFYDQREDIVTKLRVHDIPGILDFLDYSPAASGMTYRTPATPLGVTVDGVPDPAPGLPMPWESISGPQGGLTSVISLVTDVAGLTPTGYYLDKASPGGGPETQCTGDASAYGSSGTFINQGIPSTDPGIGGTNHLTASRSLYAETPALTPATSASRVDEAHTPLAATAAVRLPTAPSLTLAAHPGTVIYGSRVRLSGRLRSGVAGASVAILRTSDSRRVGTAHAGAGGAFSLRLRPLASARYIAKYSGVRSRSVRVTVRLRVRLTLRRTRPGIRISGTVTPRSARVATAALQRLGAHVHWATIGRLRLHRHGGTASFDTTRALTAGRYRVRVRGDAKRGLGTSHSARVRR